MKSSEICALAINIVAWNYGEVQYRMNNTTYFPDPTWNLLTWYNDAWHADCLGLVRAVLCGWNGNKNVTAGGADMSYLCYLYNEIQFLNSCSSTSSDFSLLEDHPCSLLYKDGHVGIYVGEFMLDGKTYNSCECTTSFGWGGRPVWVEPDGLRREYKGGSATAGYWESWGIFNTAGVDYGITEYDGGSTGATGFGSALSKEEVEHYFTSFYDQPWLTYAYLESLADMLYGMDSDFFRVFAGYVYGENPVWFDDYMLYLDSSIPVNMYMAYNMTTAQEISDFWHTYDPAGYYTIQQLTNRGNQMEADNTTAGLRSRVGIYLALMNPMQECTECVGYPVYDPRPAEARIIYTQYDVDSWTGVIPEQWALRSVGGVITYDITGSGVRGGRPDPAGRTHKGLPLWMHLRPYQNYTQRRIYRWY